MKTIKTKDPRGYFSSEIEKLLEVNGVGDKREEFNKELGVVTAMLVDGQTLYFGDDVEGALYRVIHGTKQHWAAWD